MCEWKVIVEQGALWDLELWVAQNGSFPIEDTFLSNLDGQLSLDTSILSFDNVHE